VMFAPTVFVAKSRRVARDSVTWPGYSEEILLCGTSPGVDPEGMQVAMLTRNGFETGFRQGAVRWLNFQGNAPEGWRLY
jgi:hypothetical protein